MDGRGHDVGCDGVQHSPLIPAKAGIQGTGESAVVWPWTPAFAGVSG
jgi:hypothetical protein